MRTWPKGLEMLSAVVIECIKAVLYLYRFQCQLLSNLPSVRPDHSKICSG